MQRFNGLPMPKRDLPGGWMFSFVPKFIIFVFILMLVGFIAGGVLLVKGCNKVGKHGLKSVIGDVWNGPTNQPSN